MASLALIVAGGIYLASHPRGEVSLTPSWILLACSALLLAGNLFTLSRVEGFAWPAFFGVFKWALAGYCTIAGTILYTFILDDLPSEPLLLFGLSLLVFALHVPTLIAFTSARYATPGNDGGAADRSAAP